MTITIDERKLRFQFDDTWSVVEKYDDHPDYRNAMQKLQGTSALDFVAVRGDDGPVFLIEVKDYRSLPLDEQENRLDGDLAAQGGRKVRDTIAGILGPHHRGQVDSWGPVVRRMVAPDRPIQVLLWVEDSFPSGPEGRSGNRLSVLAGRLRGQLEWLTPNVFVARLKVASTPDGLNVVDLLEESPGA